MLTSVPIASLPIAALQPPQQATQPPPDNAHTVPPPFTSTLHTRGHKRARR